MCLGVMCLGVRLSTYELRGRQNTARNAHAFYWQCKIAPPLWKTFWKFILKSKQATQQLYFSQKKEDLQSQKKKKKKTDPQMFIAALVRATYNYEQPRRPSTGECLNKLWHSHTMDYYSAIKSKLFKYGRMQMTIHKIMLNEKKKSIPKGYILVDSIYTTLLR